MDKTDYAWQIRNAVYSDIQFADTKAGFITGLATLGVALLKDLPSHLPGWKIALVIVAGLLLLGAIVASILSVRPRSARNPKGTIFWGHIAAHPDFTAYKQALEKSDSFQEVAEQAYAISRITRQKYALIAYATNFLFLGLVFLWISLLWTGLGS
jgi:hypothetical protein